MSDMYDVIVIGVGAMGSATCYQLARRGVRVLGLEQFGLPHDKGSSHGFSRMIRLAYYEHPDYVPLLRHAFSLWRRLEAESGQALLYQTGAVYIGAPGGEILDGSLRSAEEHGLPHERLDRAALARRYPQFTVPAHYEGMYELNAGFLLPERCIAAHADLAMRHGAEIHGHEPVTAWEADRLSVTVRTAAGAYRAARLVVCGGAWSDKLVRDLGVPLRVTRQVLGWVQPRTPDAFRLGNFPCWMIEHADGTGHYGFPTVSDNPGFKVAHHAPGPRVDPDTLDRNAVPADERDFRDVLRRFIPGADGPLLSLRLCMYTNSLDGHFILDRHPAHENVAVACGFSGHGFKFASVVGEAMADLATAGTTKLPIGFLGLKRFA